MPAWNRKPIRSNDQRAAVVRMAAFLVLWASVCALGGCATYTTKFKDLRPELVQGQYDVALATVHLIALLVINYEKLKLRIKKKRVSDEKDEYTRYFVTNY